LSRPFSTTAPSTPSATKTGTSPALTTTVHKAFAALSDEVTCVASRPGDADSLLQRSRDSTVVIPSEYIEVAMIASRPVLRRRRHQNGTGASLLGGFVSVLWPG
jgi:hypothetical protein